MAESPNSPWKRLQPAFGEFCRYLNVDHSGLLIPDLYSENIINFQEMETIEAIDSPIKKRKKLLTLLRAKDDERFDKFVQIVSREQPSLAQKLRPRNGELHERQTSFNSHNACMQDCHLRSKFRRGKTYFRTSRQRREKNSRETFRPLRVFISLRFNLRLIKPLRGRNVCLLQGSKNLFSNTRQGGSKRKVLVAKMAV